MEFTLTVGPTLLENGFMQSMYMCYEYLQGEEMFNITRWVWTLNGEVTTIGYHASQPFSWHLAYEDTLADLAALLA